MIKRKWKKWVGGREIKLLYQKVRERDVGPCKHTPYITVKNKAGAGLLLDPRLPGAAAWRGAAYHLTLTHSNTQGPGPGSSWAQECTAVHV